MKLVAFGASSSKNSINKEFAIYTSNQFTEYEIEILDLNNYSLPLFNVDIEHEQGIPENAEIFLNKIIEADLIIISLAEHNGTYTVVFKNIFDWMTRINSKIFANKLLVLVSTSPGARGGKGVVTTALERFPYHGAKIIGHFCLPEFKNNFDSKKGIVNEKMLTDYTEMINNCYSVLQD